MRRVHFALIIAALCFLPQALAAQTAVQPTLFGMNVQTPYSSLWPNQPIGALGKRNGTTWKWIETCNGGPDPSNSCYSWYGLDQEVAQAEAKGLTIIYSFDGVPSWAGPAVNMAPSSWTYLSDFATAVATRYRGKIQFYEEYNEPDSNGEWNDTYANLVQYAKTVYQAVKAVDPNAQVGAPVAAIQVYQPSPSPTTGASDFVGWMQGYFQAGGNQYADFAGWHAYACQEGKYGCNTTIGCDKASGNAMDCASGVIYNQYDQYRSMLSSVGLGNVPLLDSEAGWSKDDGDGFCPNYDTTACLPSLLLEPAYVSRAYIFMASAGANGTPGVQTAYWYSWGGTGNFDNGGWGTLNGSDGQNPAAGTAYGQIYSWLVGSTFTARCSVAGTVWSCPLTQPNGTPTLIVWDASQSCSTSNCTTSAYTVPAGYVNYLDLTGAANDASSGTIQIGAAPVMLVAAGPPVSTSSLGTSSITVGNAAGTSSVLLAVTPSIAAWNVSTGTAWLHPATETGIGNAVVQFSYDANSDSAARTGTITVAGQNLTVTQAGTSFVAVSSMVALPSLGLSGPQSVAVDSQGNLYVADSSNAVIEWNVSTQQATSLISSGLNSPSGLSVDGQGNVYVADTGDAIVKEWNASTQQVATMVSSGLTAPWGIGVDGQGNVYIADSTANTLTKWSASAQQLTALSTGLSNPNQLAIDTQGNIYIADSGSSCINEWAAGAGLTRLLCSGLTNPQGVAVDGQGNVYVANTGANQIAEWNAAAQQVTMLVTSGLNGPQGVAVDGLGNVYIADTNNDAVKELTRAWVSLGATSANESASGGTDSVGVQVLPAGTPLNATSDQTWLTITGTTNGSITFSFQANEASSSRSANISILGQQIAVTQSADVASTIAKTAGDNQSAPLSTTFGTGLQVTLTDSNSNPVTGATVTFNVVPGTSGAGGTFTGSASATTDANGLATAPALTANSIPGQFTVTASSGSLSATFTLTNLGALATVAPTGLTFAGQNLNTSSAAQSITLSNPGSAALSISSIAITGANTTDFSEINTCGTSVGVGGSCTISVTFTPQATGARAASLSVTDNAAGSPQSASLSGTGVGVAQISLSPATLSFGNQNVKVASAAQAITLSNPGSAALSISSIAITGANTADFSQSNNCGTSVGVGGSCTISVTFTPQATGTRSASVSITDNAAGSPQSASLSGTGVGVAQISLTPGTLSFGNQTLKVASGAQSITLSNPGSAALSISSIAITGANTTDFSQTNTCGTSVGVGGSCTISVTFTPQATGARSASVSVTDNAAGSPQSTSLSGTGVGVAQISLSPAALSFGNQNVKVASAAQAITLSNPGSAALSISSIAITGANTADFSQSNNCGTSVGVGGSCTISVTFTPQATGTRSASVSITDNAAGSPQSASLSGTGVGVAQISLSPATLSFGNQNVKVASGAQSISLSNPGSAALSITKIAITGTNTTDFSQTNTCGAKVAVGGGCTIAVTFKPLAAGARSASLSVTDNAAGSPQTAALSGAGVGVPQISLTPSSRSFGNQNLKVASAAKTFTLSNPGTAVLSITSIAITGANTADFSQSNTCGTSVGVGGSCTISVTFTPQATGARSASVSITDNAAGSPQSASLSGTGVGVPQISLSPATLSFGAQKAKTTSSAQTITLSNTGSAILSITGITITGTNPGDFSQTNTCGTSVAVGGSCTISVKFTPKVTGARSASLSIKDNAAGSPQTAALNGSGT